MLLSTNLLSKAKYILLAAVIICLASIESRSQSWVSQAQQDGFIIKKVVSDTTVATGQPFSYTIYFTIPAGATNVTITDVLPSQLKFLGHSVTSACGTPTVTAPAINSFGGTFSVNWSMLPSGCTGSFTITVAFENGTTCDGTPVRNNACITGQLLGKQYEFCTGHVLTKAVAVNPWNINKYPVGTAWQGGTCPYLTASDTITYQICVYKAVGTTGQLNLVNGIVRDTLPAGVQLVSSTCGATQSGNVITWNVGNMSATSAYNMACCQFQVYYPLAQFPSGSNITNSANLSGSLGGPNQPCGTFSIQSNMVCVEKKVVTSGSLSKWAYTNRMPGCAGQYLIYVCNTGTTPITFTALDTLPAQLSGYSMGFMWNLTASLSSGIVTISGTLPAGQCGYAYVYFTIPQTATIGSTITNCVTMTITGQSPQQACASFVVDAPAPKPCLWKEVCNKQTDYTPGSTFRYRLRIQNVGGQPITGASISDVLNPNLEYVGNPSAYIDNTWNISCTNTPANPWAGANLSYNSGTNTVTVTLDTIPATCQNVFYTSCGMYGTGGVPYYFIEFDVKVRDTSALGNVPNDFTLSGGSLGTSTYTSNIEYILVTGVVGYNLQKGVKKQSDPSYSTSTTTNAGSTIDYRLKMNSSGTASLRFVTFADLLPRNNGGSDSKILSGCASRGSQFDVAFNSLGTATPAVSSYWNNPATLLANVNGWTPTGAPGPSFTTGCGNNGSWTNAAWSMSQKNISAFFGSTAIPPTGAVIDFSADISPNAQPNTSACNSFAVSGWTKHLIQSSLPSYQLAGQLESPTACVTVEKQKPCVEVNKFDIVCAGLNSAGQQQYTFSVNANSCTPAILLISSPDGSFSPASFSLGSSPWTINTTFTHTSTNNPIKIYYTLSCENTRCRDSLMRDLPHCDNPPPVDKCCEKFIHDIGKAHIQYNSSTGFVNLNVPIFAGPVPIKKFNATIVSAQLRKVCGMAAGAWTRIFGDIVNGNLVVAPAPGPQLLTIFSREAIWGPGECIEWMKGAKLGLDMIFPPFSGGFKCHDTLMFKIRYTFTDCECRTCDTLVTYTIVRKIKLLPWDTDFGQLGTIKLKGKTESDNKILAEEPAKTSLVMEDENNGHFWVVSPESKENDVIIKALEIRSQIIPLVSVNLDGNEGMIEGDIAFINTKISAGQTANIALKFDNPNKLMQFPVKVRFVYTIEGEEELFYTDEILYTARVPGADPDNMGIDKAAKPDNVKTYALYLDNKNGYRQSIAAIALKPLGAMKVLAIGPSNAEGEHTFIVPKLQEDGSYVITTVADGTIGIGSQTMVKPIYITISGEEENANIEFTTFDGNAEIISSGIFLLTDPISTVQNNNWEYKNDVEIQSIVPNPANGVVTITFSSSKRINGAKLTIVDNLGRELMDIFGRNYTLEQGVHIRTIDLSKLSNGVYYFNLQAENSSISKPVSIVR